jgi:hypothetical protein
MSKLLLSPAFEQDGNVAYNFYREGIGFGQIESVSTGQNNGSTALITFSDEMSPEDEASVPINLHDISVYEDGEFNPKPIADLEEVEVALRFLTLGINSIISTRRKEVADKLRESYGDRLRKPRIQRAFERKLSEIVSSDAKYEYSPFERVTGF